MMKLCSYCGSENQDDAGYCRRCGTTDFVLSTPIKEEGDAHEKSPSHQSAMLPVPLPPGEVATHWRAKDAWLCVLSCVGLLLAFVVVLLAALKVADVTDYRWGRTSWVLSLLLFLPMALLLGSSLFFSRVESFIDFKLAFGLERPREKGIALSLGVGAVMAFILIQTIYGGAALLEDGKSAGLFTVAALSAPFCEEVLFRGFLYRAFRNSYRFVPAVVLVVGLSCLFHFDRVKVSPAYLAGIGLANLVLCLVKERTGNLWNCIACHFGFNTVMLLFGGK